MTPRTLKEVAQAGLVLGFEWIARDEHGTFLYANPPTLSSITGNWGGGTGWHNTRLIEITDLPPEKSLLRLRDIVEGVV